MDNQVISSVDSSAKKLFFPGVPDNLGLYFGSGCISYLGEKLNLLSGNGKILVLADPVLVKLGVINPILEGLTLAGLQYEIFTDIAPEPSDEHVNAAISVAKKINANAMVGVGGGSVMDVAKVAALCLGTGEAPETYLCPPASSATAGSLPLALIPTTSGTGSELSSFAVINCDGIKRAIVSEHIIPPLAFLDPELTVSMPASVTSSTGADAITHAIEAMMHIDATPINTALSTGALTLLSGALSKAVSHPNDLKAREDMLVGAALAMASFNLSGGLWAHSVSYVLGKHYEVPHGLGCAFGLTPLISYNESHIADKLDLIRRTIDPSAKSASAAVKAIFEAAGIPRNLKDYGVSKDRLHDLAEEMINDHPRPANPKPMTAGDAREYWQTMFNM